VNALRKPRAGYGRLRMLTAATPKRGSQSMRPPRSRWRPMPTWPCCATPPCGQGRASNPA